MISHATHTAAGGGPLMLQTVPVHPHPFAFAGCVPKATETCKCDVCGMVANTGSFAPVETRLFSMMGAQGCGQDGPVGLVVDVGANAGYFTSLSIAMGCAVLSLEPSPLVGSLLQLNIALNRNKVGLGPVWGEITHWVSGT